ncbi:MAG: hypothetical protein O7J95_11580 [Planctomycetota bacterium]|nr:hypothetical protein [Planctomycetota bacterium]
MRGLEERKWRNRRHFYQAAVQAMPCWPKTETVDTRRLGVFFRPLLPYELVVTSAEGPTRRETVLLPLSQAYMKTLVSMPVM